MSVAIKTAAPTTAVPTLKSTLRQSGDDAAGLNYKNLVLYESWNCHTYLVRIINDLHGYLGAWIRLDELSIPFDNTNTVLLFADENGIPYDNKSWSNIQLSTDFLQPETSSDPRRGRYTVSTGRGKASSFHLLHQCTDPLRGSQYSYLIIC